MLHGPKFTLVTDHNPNTFFLTQKDLHNKRHARWLDELMAFDFQFEFRPGRTNVADPLSRAPHSASLSLMINTLLAGPHDQLLQDPTSASVHYLPFVRDLIGAYKEDTNFSDQNFTSDMHFEQQMWWKGDQIVVPNHHGLIKAIFTDSHSSPYGGHYGIHKTLKAVQKYFWWPNMKADVVEYVSACESCQRNKILTGKPAGPLQPLPIPEEPWISVGMDFIVGLPRTNSAPHYDAILAFVDRLTKMTHLVPTTTK